LNSVTFDHKRFAVLADSLAVVLAASLPRCVIHLWHPEAERSQLARNEDKLADVLAGDRVRAMRGLSSLQGTSTTAARAI